MRQPKKARLEDALAESDEAAVAALQSVFTDEPDVSVYALLEALDDEESLVAAAYAGGVTGRIPQHTDWITVTAAELREAGLTPRFQRDGKLKILQERHYAFKTDERTAGLLAQAVMRRLRKQKSPVSRLKKQHAPERFAEFSRRGLLSTEDIERAEPWVRTVVDGGNR